MLEVRASEVGAQLSTDTVWAVDTVAWRASIHRAPLLMHAGLERVRAPGAHVARRCGRRSKSVSAVETRTATSRRAVVMDTEKWDGDVFWKLRLCGELDAASLEKIPRGLRTLRKEKSTISRK